jgi:hypothetical protein
VVVVVIMMMIIIGNISRPQVADAGKDLQIWSAAPNTLNKQLWTAVNG